MVIVVCCNNFFIIYEMIWVLMNDDGFCMKEEIVIDGKLIGFMFKIEN